MPRNAAGFSAALLATTALTAASPGFGQALPTGASVASGSVALSNPNAQSLVIQQGSPTAIVNWQGFSIGAANSVTFQQPSAAAAILNRVTGSAPSTLAGRLDANGQVFLVNPNGIAITQTGVVSAAGFVASTLAISDEDFRQGKLAFKGQGASAEVSNAGTISIGKGGYAALIGGTVSNSGLIEAPLGRVGFGSGEMATLDLSGDGFLQVAAPTKSGGDKALIRHSGTIKANGGRVVMTAATAREAARNAVNLSGLVQAKSVSGRSGAIVIGGGPGGAVNVSGKLTVAGGKRHAGGTIAISGRAVTVSGRLAASGARGGSIALSGESVKLSGRAVAKGFAQKGGLVTLSGDALEIAGAVNVSGAAGGGAIAVSAQKSAAVRAAATLKADATGAGTGGEITILSKGAASVKGALSAKGGQRGGDGGFIETSGASVDFVGARVDASAPKGAAGSWLIDPTDITIGTAEAAAIASGLATANVTVATPAAGDEAGDITVAAPISWASANGLTLNAAAAIAIDAPITISGAGKLALVAAFDPTISGLPLVSFGEGASVQYTGAPNTGQALSVNGQAYTLLYSMADVLGVNTNLAGKYALAKPIDAAGTTYTEAVIGPSINYNPSPFTGALEGLGNSVSNVTLDLTDGESSGFIGIIGATGRVSNFGLAALNYSDSPISTGRSGGLVGTNNGVVSHAVVTGAYAPSSGGVMFGGLVGSNRVSGLVVDSVANLSISVETPAYLTTLRAGGLAAENFGAVIRSHASGDLTASGDGCCARLGGLVYFNSFGGSIVSSSASGNITSSAAGEFGGLVATNNGTIDRSYATGAVSVSSETSELLVQAGGLVGDNGPRGVITQSHAAGNVDTSTSLAWAGGFVGFNGGAIAQSQSSGTVSYSASEVDQFWIGGFAGYNGGTIEDSVSSSATHSNSGAGGYIGGLVGYNNKTVLRSSASGAVTASTECCADAGGLVGFNSANAAIRQSFATGAVTVRGGGAAGGLVGLNGGLVDDSHASGNAWAGSRYAGAAGGLVGSNLAGARVEDSYATGDAAAYWSYGVGDGGGLVGANAGAVLRSYAEGDVTAGAAGGLVGRNTGSISQSHASGVVTGDVWETDYARVGGLVGVNSGSIEMSYSTGAARPQDSGWFSIAAVSGGLVGENSGSISQSYATGPVTGALGSSLPFGGLVGRNTGVVQSSYWDKETTGLSAGFGANTGSFGAKGLATSQFFSVKSFAGWTFGTTPGAAGWVIVDNGGTINNANGQAGGTRPMLLSEYTADIVNGHQLQLMALAPSAAYTLKADIDFGAAQTNRSEVWQTMGASAPWWGYGFVPIGTWAPQFTGTFDGDGHTISNLQIYRPYNSNVGLFGYVGEGGVVKNVALLASVAGYDRVGALVGKNHGLVENVTAAVSVMGQFHTGGLVGWNAGSIVNGATPSGAVSAISDSSTPVGEVDIGGLVGRNDGAVRQSHAAATVSYSRDVNGAYGPWRVGGLVGLNTGLIAASDASNDVNLSPVNTPGGGQTTPFMAGGLVGRNEGVVRDSSASGAARIQLTSQGAATLGAAAGGLVGVNAGSILRSHATGGAQATVSRSCCSAPFAAAGGLVGINVASGSISQSYATSYGAALAIKTSASGLFGPRASAGGLVGENDGLIERSYALGIGQATANVLNDNFVPLPSGQRLAQASAGGLVGVNASSILQSYAQARAYSEAKASDPETVLISFAGGLVGRNSGVVEEAYATGLVASRIGSSVESGAGGLVGENTGSVLTAYWDVQTTLQSAGVFIDTGLFSASGLTTQQLKAGLPAGFDPAVWSIVPGVTYPYLK